MWIRIASLSLKGVPWPRSSLTFRQTIECGFTLNLVRDMIITYSQYVPPFKYTFCLKVSTTVPIKSVNDKHQITTTFTVSATGYYTKVKTKDLYKNANFQRKFTLFTLRPLTEFQEICRLISIATSKKAELAHPEDHFSLIVIDTFKGQDNESIESLCLDNCDLVIVPHNLTNKFQPLDTNINQKNKKFFWS